MNFSQFPEIETDRLRLRRLTQNDADDLLFILSDPDVTKDMGVAPFERVEQAENLINFMNDLFTKRHAFRLGIVRKEDDILMGTCGYNGWEIHRGSRGEVAYDLGKKYWRKGYGTEAVSALIHFGFEQMNLHRIEAFTNLDATPSMGLLNKLGFREEGVLRGYASFHGGFDDQRLFALLKTDHNVLS